MWQFDNERRPLSIFRMDGDVSLVQVDNLLGQRQADAVPGHLVFLVAPVEEGEEVLLVCFRHADTVVRKTDDRPLVPERNLDEG